MSEGADVAVALLARVRTDEGLRRDLQLRWLEVLEEIADLLSADASGDVAAAVNSQEPHTARGDCPGWPVLADEDRRVVAEAWVDDCVVSDAIVPIEFREIAHERQQARGVEPGGASHG